MIFENDDGVFWLIYPLRFRDRSARLKRSLFSYQVWAIQIFRTKPNSTSMTGSMQIVCSRTIPSIDEVSLALSEAKEALFRDDHGFILYLTKDVSIAPGDERILRLEAREALIWLNEEPEDQGSFWI